MNKARINVISVPRCSPVEGGAQMDIETDQGHRLELAISADAFREWALGCECPSNMRSERHDVVGVPGWRPSAHGAELEFETARGERIGVRMSSQALAECAASCTQTTSAATGVTSFACSAAPEHVTMRLSFGPSGASTEFLLPEGDAVLLAVHLLEAARMAREQPQS